MLPPVLRNTQIMLSHHKSHTHTIHTHTRTHTRTHTTRAHTHTHTHTHTQHVYTSDHCCLPSLTDLLRLQFLPDTMARLQHLLGCVREGRTKVGGAESGGKSLTGKAQLTTLDLHTCKPRLVEHLNVDISYLLLPFDLLVLLRRVNFLSSYPHAPLYSFKRPHPTSCHTPSPHPLPLDGGYRCDILNSGACGPSHPAPRGVPGEAVA